MNSTIKRFGYPDTLVAEYDNWLVLLRPDQPTLGSLVLAARGEETSFSALPPAAFAEMGSVVWHIESTLKRAVQFERINYLMLMMVDPHVHFHVVPRYAGARSHSGIEVEDAGWPKQPALDRALPLTPAQTLLLATWLRGLWTEPRSTAVPGAGNE